MSIALSELKMSQSLLTFMGVFWCLMAHAQTMPNPLLARSVVKIVASNAQHKTAMGSGVVVAKDQVVTNCHVTQGAHSIAVLKSAIFYKALSQVVDGELDICLLHVKNLPIPSVSLGSVASISINDKVFAYGYPNAVGISLQQGKVTKLFPYHSSQVIETTVGINHGASGGGLFDAKGKLIGLTTFFRSDNGGRFYAIPVDWLKKLIDQDGQAIEPFAAKPFWLVKNSFVQQNSTE
ncbi:MAG: serine protease [Methylococcaceae bacterium]